MIIQSPYLRLMAILLISYSFSINLVEGIWMFKARQMYPTADGFMAFQGRVLFWTGVLTIICALMGSTLIQKVGWIWGAILTPSIMLVFGTMFFSVILFEEEFSIVKKFLNVAPLTFIVVTGALWHIFSKGLKYSLFDATKEMAYIPLDNEQKTKGKAAVDIVGAKIGKSAGSLIQITIFTIFPFVNYDDIAGLLMVLFIIICITWAYAAKALSVRYNKRINAQLVKM